jgi:hypothetical protein
MTQTQLETDLRKELEDRLQFETLLADLSAGFAKLPRCRMTQLPSRPVAELPNCRVAKLPNYPRLAYVAERQIT